MAEAERIDALEVQISEMEEAIGGAGRMVSAFNGELRRMQSTMTETGRAVQILSRGIQKGLKASLEDFVFEGESLSHVLRNLTGSIVRATYNAGVDPVTRQVSSALAGGIENFIQAVTPFRSGGAIAQGRVMPFAAGGIVSGPTVFPLRGGVGLMGEAGPEAIVPLARRADGRLGVLGAGGARPVHVTINVTTPDAESFRRSQGQVAAQVARALGRADRHR